MTPGGSVECGRPSGVKNYFRRTQHRGVLPSGIDAVKASGKPVWVDLHDYDGRNPYYEPFIEVATHIRSALKQRQTLSP
jgi:hypothetical protein